MLVKPIRRVRQSSWYDICVFLIIIAVALFLLGAYGQIRHRSLLLEAREASMTYNTQTPTDFFANSYQTFYALGLICLITISLGVISLYITPWLQQSSLYIAHIKRIRVGLRYTLCIAVSAIMFFPVYWMLLTSLQSSEELLQQVPSMFPKQLHWENYLNILRYAPIGRYFYNTIVSTVFIMAGQLLFGVFAAYGFGKGNFKCKNALFMMVLCTMMIPIQITFVPSYVIISKLNWLNTFAGLIVPNLASAFFIFLLRQSFMAIDDSYLDAGKVDGMGRIRSIFSVLVPMCKPAVMTVGIFAFINGWNSYFWPKMITTTEKRRTIATGIHYLRRTFTGAEAVNYNEIMAGAVLGMIPVLILFLLFQRYIVTDMYDTSVR